MPRAAWSSRASDGVVFVGDSQARQARREPESLQNLQSNLLDRRGIRTIPLVLQYKSRTCRAS